MIEAEPALAGRVLERLRRHPRAGTARPRAAAHRGVRPRSAGQADGRDRLRHERARRARAVGDPSRRDARRAGRREPGPVSAQAFEAALDPQRGGLLVGVSHEGGTGATNRGDRCRPGRGRARRRRYRQRALPRRGHRRDRPGDRGARPELVPHGGLPLAVAGGRRGRGGAPRGAGRRCGDPGAPLAAASNAQPRRKRPPGASPRASAHRRRLGRGSAGRPRAGPQDRGGRLGADGLARPRDVPPRPPAGHRRLDRARAAPRRPGRPRRPARPGRARRWRPPGRSASARRGSSAPAAAAAIDPAPDARPGAWSCRTSRRCRRRWPRSSGRRRRSSSSPSDWPAPAGRTPTRSAATTLAYRAAADAAEG